MTQELSGSSIHICLGSPRDKNGRTRTEAVVEEIGAIGKNQEPFSGLNG